MLEYVDDMSFFEVVSINKSSTIQLNLDHNSCWADRNYMSLNPKRCKENIVHSRSFGFTQAVISDMSIEILRSHKLLGTYIQDDFKWGTHVDMIVKKASKPLHIIRSLNKYGIPPQNLVTIYIALIRSVLEYGCIVCMAQQFLVASCSTSAF